VPTLPTYQPNPDAQLGRARHGAGQARDVQHVQGAALRARFAPSCAAPAPVPPPPLLGRVRAPPAPRSSRPLPRRSGPRVGQSLLRRRARPRAGTPGGGLAPGVRAPRQDGRTRRVDGRYARWPQRVRRGPQPAARTPALRRSRSVGGRPGGGSPLHARPAGLPPGRRGTGPARGVRRRPQPAEQAVHARGLGATGKGPQACRRRAAPVLLLGRLSSTPDEGRGAARLRAAQPCAPRPERRPAGAAIRAGRPGAGALHIDAQVRWRHLHSWGQLWRQQRSIRPRAAERPALRTGHHEVVQVIPCGQGKRL